LVGAVIKRLSYGRRDGVAMIAEGLVLGIDPADLERLEDVERDSTATFASRRSTSARSEGRGPQAAPHLRHPDGRSPPKNIGYELRCADPIPGPTWSNTRDLGYCAAKYLLSGGSAVMVSMQGGNFVRSRSPTSSIPTADGRACGWWTSIRRATASRGAT